MLVWFFLTSSNIFLAAGLAVTKDTKTLKVFGALYILAAIAAFLVYKK